MVGGPSRGKRVKLVSGRGRCSGCGSAGKVGKWNAVGFNFMEYIFVVIFELD